MSNSIRMESLTLKPMDGTNFNIHYEKEKNIQFEESLKIMNNSVGAVMNISVEGRLKSQNQTRPEGELKKAGTTSERSAFEDFGLDDRNYSRGMGRLGWPSAELQDEWMRTDEPETYAKMEELMNKSVESGGYGSIEERLGTEEGQQYSREASMMRWDWFCRKCYGEDGWIRNPVSGQRTVISALEAMNSDSDHDTTVGVYDGKSLDQVSYLWEISTKFNVLLPNKMLNKLEALNHLEQLSEKEKKDLNQDLEKINDSVRRIKDAEISYEGTHMYLRFGVMFDDEGNVSYHANYTGCEDKNGIKADSTEELLKMLMEK